jgi:hypothetical protein
VCELSPASHSIFPVPKPIAPKICKKMSNPSRIIVITRSPIVAGAHHTSPAALRPSVWLLFLCSSPAVIIAHAIK